MTIKFKIITIVVSILLLLGGFITMNKNKDSNHLKVAFPVRFLVSAYEPTAIKFDFEYIFLENVFSPLVEISANGTIEPGVAEKVDWIGDELKLTIRKDLKTISGKPITADDVVFSLKRLLVLSGNTHGNFKDIVCPGADIKSTEDDCPGIREEGNFVFINAKGKKSFLLPMLGAIDFAVVPKSSVDPSTLKIVDYSETSGPYSVQSDDGNGKIELKLNTHHYFASKNVPQQITLVPTDSKSGTNSIKAFEDGLIDHIMTVDRSKTEDVIKYAKQNQDNDLLVTMKIRTLVLVFTQKGEQQLTASERRYIGQALKEVFAKLFSETPGAEQRDEFFPNLGEGGLTVEQQALYKKESKKDRTAPALKVKLGLLTRVPLKDWAEPIQQKLPMVESEVISYIPDFNKDLKPDEIPHAFIGFTDTGFMEDISLISYSLNSGVLGLSPNKRAEWLSDYMATDDKAVRINKLKNLHYEALTRPTVFPLIALPYTALVRKPWKLELSELYANNQLWRIKLH
ncbi:MAG: hypothetical protein JNL11_17015 [Bdellovibrionaceae bacterium]|nr:hypothetical protein [Pseudobdellovibrionaceae bacterium]